MYNTWFGHKPWGRICKDLEHVETPIGEVCLHCDEKIGPDDDGEMIFSGDGLRPIHRECLMRSVIGSLGHQMGKCSCYGGVEEDPPDCTKREAAIIATAYFERTGQA